MPIAARYAARLKGFRTSSFLQAVEFFHKAWKTAMTRSAGKDPEPFIREEFAKVVDTGVEDGLQREAMELIADRVARRLKEMRGHSSAGD